MKARLLIDDAVGEMRRALLDPAGLAFRLETERWTERACRARVDDLWWGRVRGRMPGQRGWFVDLGLERDGVIEPARSRRLVEGEMLLVRVKSEAWSQKGPALSLADMRAGMAPPEAPQRHQPARQDSFLAGVDVIETCTGLEARREIEAALEEACIPFAHLPGGGDISIETTRGLTAIDVDAGPRTGELDKSDFALSLNLEAAEEAARHVSLRGIGGLLVIDFVRMSSAPDRRKVVGRLRGALASRLGRSSEVLELSDLGMCEAAIARRARPLRDGLFMHAAEREALDALREIETAGRVARSGRIRARISPPARSWLESAAIGWREALAGRIGERWIIETAEREPGRPDVWSQA